MPALDQCLVSGTLFDASGEIAGGIVVKIIKTQKTGEAIKQGKIRSDPSDAVTGEIEFELPRACKAWLSGRFYIGSIDFNVPTGVEVDIPDASTVTLESLGAAVSGPTTGITTKSSGAALANLINTYDFSSSFVVTESPTGEANIDLASSTESVQDTVGAMVPASMYTYNDGPGTLTLTPLAANRIWAGPASGADAVPTARALVAADIPSLTAAKISDFAAAVLLVAPAPAWGSITGSLSSQTDLVSALAGKSDVGHTHTFASLTSKPTTLAGYGIVDAQGLNTKLTDFGALANGAGWLHNDGAGVFVYSIPSKSDVGLGNVSNNAQLTIANNLSDLNNAGTARTNLGLAIGSNVQAWDADLDAIAAIPATSGLLKKTAANTWSLDTSTYATQAYADALVVGLLDDRGNHDASVNTFPASGGSGAAGAILKGDLWTISVAGTLGGTAVTAGDVVRALADTPGQTSGNWAIGENNFGYVALNQSLASGKIYVGNGSGIGTAVTPSGDVTMDNAGVVAIGASKVTNAMLAGSIAYSKLSLTGAILNADLAGSIDLASKVTGILPTANGGTGIAFFTAAGPTVARVYTFPNANATIARTDAGQTFTGSNTFSSAIAIASNGVAGDGVFYNPNGGGRVYLGSSGLTNEATVRGANAWLNTGGTDRWKVDGSGHFLAVADNTYDIGASAATRPRTGYFGTSVVTPAITLQDGNIILGTTTGTKIGTSASQKLALWNATPIVQPSGANQAALTDSTTGTPGFTLSDVGIVFSQAAINTNFASLARLVDNMRTAMVNTGLMKGSS